MKPPEVWMRGPIPGVPELLQPVAHALLQVKEETWELMGDFPWARLWVQPLGMASVAFHIRHICGVIDRMFSYADKQPLTEVQMDYLGAEAIEDLLLSKAELLMQLDMQVNKAIEALKRMPVADLTEPRGIGRKQIPTTLIGLLFHAAEHSQRHLGQLLVTAKLVQAT